MHIWCLSQCLLQRNHKVIVITHSYEGTLLNYSKCTIISNTLLLETRTGNGNFIANTIPYKQADRESAT
jgi:hypothetical protein